MVRRDPSCIDRGHLPAFDVRGVERVERLRWCMQWYQSLLSRYRGGPLRAGNMDHFLPPVSFPAEAAEDRETLRFWVVGSVLIELFSVAGRIRGMGLPRMAGPARARVYAHAPALYENSGGLPQQHCGEGRPFHPAVAAVLIVAQPSLPSLQAATPAAMGRTDGHTVKCWGTVKCWR
jgi:hypothetical protein